MQKIMAACTELVARRDEEGLLEWLDEEERDLNFRDEQGRTPLDLATILGREEIIRVLVERGADVNLANASVYTPLHHGAAWGRLNCLKLLVASGADHQPKTRHSEVARDIAHRYSKTECVEYLDCVEARFQLSEAVKGGRSTLGDSERITGKWNKDDKSKVTALCNEKSSWLELNAEASLGDIREQEREFQERFQPYLAKLNPPEN